MRADRVRRRLSREQRREQERGDPKRLTHECLLIRPGLQGDGAARRCSCESDRVPWAMRAGR